MSDFERLGEVERSQLELEQFVFAGEILMGEVQAAIADRKSRDADETETITVSRTIDGTSVFAHMPRKKSTEAEIKEGE